MSKDIDITDISTSEKEKILKDLFIEFMQLENESKSISERKKELREYAEKKGVNFKAFKEAVKQLQQPVETRQKENHDCDIYISILEKF